MAETETDQILEGVELPAEAPAETPETPPAETPNEPEAAAPEVDTTEAEPETPDTTVGDAGADKTTNTASQQPPVSDADYRQAVTTLEGLQGQQKTLDDQLEQLDKDMADGKIDALDAGPRIQLLTARQNRLERQIAAATNSVTQQQQAVTKQRDQALESHWKTLGTKFADIAETPDRAVEALKDLWDEEYEKAQKANPGLHPERVAGKAEAAWENRIAVMRATKGKPNKAAPSGRTAPGRLTPGTGSVPPSPGKENSAVIAERTLGPLSDYKF